LSKCYTHSTGAALGFSFSLSFLHQTPAYSTMSFCMFLLIAFGLLINERVMDDQGSWRYLTVERRPGRVYTCFSWFMDYYHPITLASITDYLSHHHSSLCYFFAYWRFVHLTTPRQSCCQGHPVILYPSTYDRFHADAWSSDAVGWYLIAIPWIPGLSLACFGHLWNV
jgi:hypothetical protein